MYLIREVFHTKPVKAKDLVKKFKQATPYFKEEGIKCVKVMTDIATTYRTVIVQSEVEDLVDSLRGLRGATSQPKVEQIMEGYLDLVERGSREIYLIE